MVGNLRKQQQIVMVDHLAYDDGGQQIAHIPLKVAKSSRSNVTDVVHSMLETFQCRKQSSAVINPVLSFKINQALFYDQYV